MKKLNWQEHCVLITGAGHGLGRALSLELARAGAFIICTDIDEIRAKTTEEAVKSCGGKAVSYAMDVTQLDSIKKTQELILREVGPITFLVNNAGIISGGEFNEVPLAQHLKTLDINVLGVVRATHVFLPEIIKGSVGGVVNIASAAAFLALPFATSYAASKWAVLGFSDSLREELRLKKHHHVGVTSVCPSYISTGMFQGVKLPWLMKWVSPERLAQQICRAIEKKQEQILTPWNVLPVPFAKGVLPQRWFLLLCRGLGVSQSMRAWRGH